MEIGPGMHQIKIQQQPRRTFTVRELARALNMSGRDLMEASAAAGEWVTSVHCRLEEPAARRVVDYLGQPWPFPEANRTTSVQAATPPRTTAPSGGLRPAKPRPRRDNHPLIEPWPRPRDLPVDEHRASLRPRPQRSRLRPRTPPMTDPVALAFATTSEDDTEAFSDYSWQLRGFSEAERDEWISVGIQFGKARLAANLRDAGFVPSILLTEVDGVAVRARLKRGDGIEAVLRLLDEFGRADQAN